MVSGDKLKVGMIVEDEDCEGVKFEVVEIKGNLMKLKCIEGCENGKELAKDVLDELLKWDIPTCVDISVEFREEFYICCPDVYEFKVVGGDGSD